MASTRRMAQPWSQARPFLCAEVGLRWAVLAASTMLAIGFAAPAAVAQGCAMCYQNAAASGSQGSAALRHGILVLLIPAISIFLGVFGVTYHRRNATR